MTGTQNQQWIDFYEERSKDPNPMAAACRTNMDVVGYLYLLRDFAAKLELGRTDRLLDIGCGPGVFTLGLAQWAGHVHGIDPSEGMVERAREVCVGCPNATFSCGSMTAPGVEGSSWESILAATVTQYLDGEELIADALQVHRRLLTPGGRALYSSVPDPALRPAYEARIRQAPYGKEEDRQRSLDALDRILWTDRDRMVAMARSAGFAARILAIPPRIWQSIYMYDVLLARE